MLSPFSAAEVGALPSSAVEVPGPQRNRNRVSTGISIRDFRTGFLFVVALLGAATAFTLWGELKTNEQVDALVSRALARDVLVGRIRVDALNLEAAVDDHIQAQSDEERQAADARMEEILAGIKKARNEYVQDLAPGELGVWKELSETCRQLAQQVRAAVNYSNRKEAERARKHLVQEIRPMSAALDRLGEELARENGQETSLLLRQLEDLRFRATALGVFVAVMAVGISLIVGLRLTSQLRRQEETIQAQLRELDRRNQELDSFASRVAHDLVAPLSPLKGYLALIRRSNAIDDKNVQEMVALAEMSAGRMAELVEALLRFCRAGTPGDSAMGQLDTAVQAILMEVSQSAAAHGVKLDRQLDQDVTVPCSAQLLQSIAQNLLSNAVKYSAGTTDSRVVVRVFKDRGQATLEVTDNGPGMSEDTQRNLFQPFFRADKTRHLPGYGLGLATTKRLIEAHGGQISVRSGVGAGTQMTVKFPLAAPRVPPTAREPLAAVG
jgi:two-component system OmpR family sensor kinase